MLKLHYSHYNAATLPGGLAMKTQDRFDEEVAAFKASFEGLHLPKPLPFAGSSGPLGDVFLPPETVDEMEAAIEEAFEQVDEDQVADDGWDE
jgi:hypothetical protein